MYIRTLTHYKSYIILQTKCKTNIESILKIFESILKIFDSILKNLRKYSYKPRDN